MFGLKQLENQGILPSGRQWRTREGSRRKILNLRLDVLGLLVPTGPSSVATNGAPKNPDIQERKRRIYAREEGRRQHGVPEVEKDGAARASRRATASDIMRTSKKEQQHVQSLRDFREVRAGDGDWIACSESRSDEIYK